MEQAERRHGFIQHWIANCVQYKETEGTITLVYGVKLKCEESFQVQREKQPKLAQPVKVSHKWFTAMCYQRKTHDWAYDNWSLFMRKWKWMTSAYSLRPITQNDLYEFRSVEVLPNKPEYLIIQHISSCECQIKGTILYILKTLMISVHKLLI